MVSSDACRWRLSAMVHSVAKEEDSGWHRGIFGAAACGEQGLAGRGRTPPGGGFWAHEDGGRRHSLMTVAAHGRAESKGDRYGDGERGDGVRKMGNENICPRCQVDKDDSGNVHKGGLNQHCSSVGSEQEQQSER
jgi:hypothetical protein